jgi:hypothetical protein
LEAEMVRASGEIEHFIIAMEEDVRNYIQKKSPWTYAPFCGVL